jgi:hypothetical protein
MLNLSNEAIDMLNLVDSEEFNIFQLRELTHGNEMLSLLPWVLTKRNCFTNTDLDLEHLI